MSRSDMLQPSSPTSDPFGRIVSGQRREIGAGFAAVRRALNDHAGDCFGAIAS